MTGWQRNLARTAYAVESRFDTLKFRLRRRIGRVNAVMILPYRGYGTRALVTLRGRVVERRDITTPGDDDSRWQNIMNTYRRFASDEIPGARLHLTFGNVDMEAVTNRDGVFEFRFTPDPALFIPGQAWYDATLELVEYPGPRQDDTRVTATILIPPDDAQFGLISDLDDTVLQSDVVHLLRLVRNTFLGNARTRLPFEGVAAFYQALQAGTAGSFNPVFYVSSSPWNLYDLIDEFFRVRGIPIGPLFMASLGITEQQLFKPDRRRHKLNQITQLLDTYSALPFVLVGDSGELDPEIYLQVVLDHPGRIRAIYIRDVSRTERDRFVQAIAERVRAAGSEMLLVRDTWEAAQHAVSMGLISPETLPMIRTEQREDHRKTDTVERVPGETS